MNIARLIGYTYGLSAGVVAIAWVLQHPAVTGAIVGGRRADQVDSIIGAAEFRMKRLEMAELEEFLR